MSLIFTPLSFSPPPGQPSTLPSVLLPIIHVAGADLISSDSLPDLVDLLAPEELLIGNIPVPQPKASGTTQSAPANSSPSLPSAGQVSNPQTTTGTGTAAGTKTNNLTSQQQGKETTENSPILLHPRFTLDSFNSKLGRETWPLSIDLFLLQLESTPKITKGKKAPQKPQGLKLKVEYYGSGWMPYGVGGKEDKRRIERELKINDMGKNELGSFKFSVEKSTPDGTSSYVDDLTGQSIVFNFGHLEVDGAAPLISSIVQGEVKIGEFSFPIIDGRGQQDGSVAFEDCVQEYRLLSVLQKSPTFNPRPELTLSEQRRKAEAGELKKGSKVTDVVFDRTNEAQQLVDSLLKMLKECLHPKTGGNEALQTAYNVELIPTIAPNCVTLLAACFDKTRVMSNATNRVLNFSGEDIQTLSEELAKACHSSIPALTMSVWPPSGETMITATPHVVGGMSLGELLLIGNKQMQSEIIFNRVEPSLSQQQQGDGPSQGKGRPSSRPSSSKGTGKQKGTASSPQDMVTYSLMRPKMSCHITLQSPVCPPFIPPSPIVDDSLNISEKERVLRVVSECSAEQKSCKLAEKKGGPMSQKMAAEASFLLEKAINEAVRVLRDEEHTESDALRVVLGAVQDGLDPSFGGRMVTPATNTRIQKLTELCSSLKQQAENSVFDLHASLPSRNMEVIRNVSNIYEKINEATKLMDDDPTVKGDVIDDCCYLRLEMSMLLVFLFCEPIGIIIDAVANCRRHVNRWKRPELLLAAAFAAFINGYREDSRIILSCLMYYKQEELDGVTFSALGIMLERLIGFPTPLSAQYWEQGYKSVSSSEMYCREIDHNNLVLSVAERLMPLLPNYAILDMILGSYIPVNITHVEIENRPAQQALPTIKIDPKSPPVPVSSAITLSPRLSPKSEAFEKVVNSFEFRMNMLRCGGGDNGGWIYAYSSDDIANAYKMIKAQEQTPFCEFASLSPSWKVLLIILTSSSNKAEEAAKMMLSLAHNVDVFPLSTKVQCCNALLIGSDLIDTKTQLAVSDFVIKCIGNDTKSDSPASILSLSGYALGLRGNASQGKYLLEKAINTHLVAAPHYIRYATVLLRCKEFDEVERKAVLALYSVNGNTSRSQFHNSETRLLCYECIKADRSLIDIASRICDTLKITSNDGISRYGDDPIVHSSRYRQLKLNLECSMALGIDELIIDSSLEKCICFLNTNPCLKLETIQEKVELIKLSIERKGK